MQSETQLAEFAQTHQLTLNSPTGRNSDNYNSSTMPRKTSVTPEKASIKHNQISPDQGENASPELTDVVARIHKSSMSTYDKKQRQINMTPVIKMSSKKRMASSMGSASGTTLIGSLQTKLDEGLSLKRHSSILLQSEDRRLISETDKIELDVEYDRQVKPIFTENYGVTDDITKFPSNKIRTALYTQLSIFPVAFMLQFTKVANIYWGICAILQFYKPIQTANPIFVIATLLVVVLVGVFKEFWADSKR